MNIINNNNLKKITYLLFIIYFLIGAATFKDYGITTDEEFQRSSGFYWLNYVLSFTPFDQLRSAVELKISKIGGFTLPGVEGNQFYGVVFDLPAAFLEVIFEVEDSKNYFHLKHFFNFLLFFSASIFFYKILLNRFKNPLIALTGTLFFILSPRIYGNSFFNMKDIVSLSLLTISLFYCFKLLDKANFKNFLIFSIFSALCTAQRMYGICIPISFIIFYLLSLLSKKENLNDLAGVIFFCFSFFVFLILFWPYLWSNPITNFFLAYKYMAHHNLYDQIKILFNGEYVPANSVPYSYIFTWILISSPLFYIILFIFGYAQIFTRFFSKFINLKSDSFYYDFWRSVNEKKDFFIFFNLTSIIFYLIIFNISMANGWRHSFFLHAFIIYISVYALYRVNLSFKSILKKKILFSALFFYLVFIVYKMTVYHPYQNLYFNSFFNNNAHKKFDIDYWGLSGNKFLKNVIKLEQNKEKIIIGVASYLPLERSIKLLDKEDREKVIVIGQEYQKSDYLYSNLMSDVDKSNNDKYKIPENFSKISEFILDGVTIYEVYKKIN